MQFIKKLNGNSGCDVSLYKHEDSFIVRKISPSVSYNSRLIVQCNRQDICNIDGVFSPKVYGSGYNDSLFYFDSEYIDGKTLNIVAQEKNPDDTYLLINKILHGFSSHSTGNIDNQIKSKLFSLKEKCDFKYQYYIDFCFDFDWSLIPSTACHGDLTFENIIIKNNDIYLIDFLDVFASSYYIDLSKIMTDILFGWSWRKIKDIPLVKNVILYDKIREKLTDLEFNACKRLIIIHLLRIISYCNDDNTSELIDNSLKSSIDF